MGSYSMVPLGHYLVETQHSSSEVSKHKAEETSQVDHDHVVLSVAARFEESAEETGEIRIAVGDPGSASCYTRNYAGQTRAAEYLLQSSTSYYLFYLVGATSIFVPFITGDGALHMLPWILNLSGFLSLLQYSCVRNAPGSTAIFFLATLHLTTGVWMLRKPAVGEAALSYLIGAWFLIHGTLKLWMSLQVRKLTTWPALFASGLLSIILACVSQHLSPELGLSPVDIYIRVEFLLTGCAAALLLYSIISYLHNQKLS